MATDSRDVSRRQFVLGLGAGLIVGGSFQLHFGSEPPGLFAAAVRFLA